MNSFTDSLKKYVDKENFVFEPGKMVLNLNVFYPEGNAKLKELAGQRCAILAYKVLKKIPRVGNSFNPKISPLTGYPGDISYVDVGITMHKEPGNQ
jgi:hypothetical protein